MANTKIPVELSSTPGIVDGSNATAITIDSSENVGIGTTSPTDVLTVAGNITISDGSPEVTFQTGASHYNWQLAAQESTNSAFEIAVGSADADASNDSFSALMTVLQSGNVGIGTTSPTRPLTVAGSMNLTGTGTYIFGGDNEILAGQDSGGYYFATGNSQDVNKTIYIGDNASSINFATGNSEKMRINSSGAVLMGTTTQLHSSQLTVDNPSGQCGITLSETGTSVTALWGLDSLNAIGTRSNHAFNIRSNDTNRMTFDSSGKVFIGLTAQINSSMLSVGDGGVGITYSGAPANYYRQIYQSSSGNLFFYNGSNQGYIDQAGAFNDASDERIKKDIEDISYGLDTVKALKPRKYKMKLNDDEQIGFIAQEVESLVPEIVNTDVTPDGEEQKGMSYGHLTAVLTKAIQEQQTLIETLQAKVEALENG